MTTISAKTILRSRNAAAPQHVLSTLLLRYPRCIHAEFMTHRVLSRNAASSRAIPVEKLIADVLADPFVPLFWGANQKGMQAGAECTEKVRVKNGLWDRQRAWEEAMYAAVASARAFSEAGYHKQIVNRLLEPFAHITTLVSSTEWSNFLALRDHPDAEPHIAVLAREVRKCLDREDDIMELQPGQWHMPFTDQTDEEADQGPISTKLQDYIKLSVSRCASTSYRTTDGFDMTLERAQALYDKLFSKPFHASPFEHQAVADTCDCGTWGAPNQHRNFIGFRQFRAIVEDESA